MANARFRRLRSSSSVPAPTDILLSTQSVSNLAQSGSIAAILSALPPRAQVIDFDLLDDGGGAFLIEAATLKTKAALTAGTVNITVRATNAQGASFTKTIPITVTADATAAPAFSLATLPTPTGTPRVNNVLNFTCGAVTGTPAPAVTWQVKADGTAITGASGTGPTASYRAALAQQGKVLTCTFTLTSSAGTVSKTTPATAAIQAPVTGQIVRPAGLDYQPTGYGSESFGTPYNYQTDIPANCVDYPGAFANIAAAAAAVRSGNKAGIKYAQGTYSGDWKQIGLVPMYANGGPGSVVIKRAGSALATDTPAGFYFTDRSCDVLGIQFEDFGDVFGWAPAPKPRGSETAYYARHTTNVYGFGRGVTNGLQFRTDRPVGSALNIALSYGDAIGGFGPSVRISDCIFKNCQHGLFILSDTIIPEKVHLHRNKVDGTYGLVDGQTTVPADLYATGNEWFNCLVSNGRQLFATPNAHRFHTCIKWCIDNGVDVEVRKQTIIVENNAAGPIQDAYYKDSTNCAVFYDGRQTTPATIDPGTGPNDCTCSISISFNKLIDVRGIDGQEDANGIYAKTRGAVIEGNYLENVGSEWVTTAKDGAEGTGIVCKDPYGWATPPAGAFLAIRGNKFVRMPAQDNNNLKGLSVIDLNNEVLTLYLIGNEFEDCHNRNQGTNSNGIIRIFGKTGAVKAWANKFTNCQLGALNRFINLHEWERFTGAASDCEFSNNHAYYGATEDYTADRAGIGITTTGGSSSIKIGAAPAGSPAGFVGGAMNILHGSGGEFVMQAMSGTASTTVRSYSPPLTPN